MWQNGKVVFRIFGQKVLLDSTECPICGKDQFYDCVLAQHVRSAHMHESEQFPWVDVCNPQDFVDKFKYEEED